MADTIWYSGDPAYGPGGTQGGFNVSVGYADWDHPITIDGAGRVVFCGDSTGWHYVYVDFWTPDLGPVSTGDYLFAYVWLDTVDTPQEVHLGWKGSVGGWRWASWGTDLSTASPKTVEGALPATGQWVRLAVPIADIGFVDGETFDGFSLGVYDGAAYYAAVGQGTALAESSSDPQVTSLETTVVGQPAVSNPEITTIQVSGVVTIAASNPKVSTLQASVVGSYDTSVTPSSPPANLNVINLYY